MTLSVKCEQLNKILKKIDYKGCRNCEHQIASTRMCKWAENGGDGELHFYCPKWSKRIDKKGIEYDGKH